MKISLISLVIASVMLITSNLHAQKKNVLDYYKMLEVSQEYKITKTGEKYQTVGITEEPFDVTVDFKNGYIEIKDEGTGGGTLFYQVVLYRKSDGSALIAMTSQVFDGVSVGCEIDFFEEKDGKLVSKTSKYFPGKDYFIEKFPKILSTDEKEVLGDVVNPVYDLPQNGLTINIMYQVKSHVGKENKKQFDLQQRLLKMGPVFLKWKFNKVTDQFEIVNS
ncbi:MAG: hypothetical protein KDC84_09710 [Crocinitomicaceae bacterium]|nr:hypothetical protein [Crocinitomicaceae bacterium]